MKERHAPMMMKMILKMMKIRKQRHLSFATAFQRFHLPQFFLFVMLDLLCQGLSSWGSNLLGCSAMFSFFPCCQEPESANEN